MNKIYYFAYGSNMSSERLKLRCPSAKVIGLAEVKGRRFAWNVESKDGSAKANIIEGSAEDKIFGVLYEIKEQDKYYLRRAEGYPKNYREWQCTFSPQKHLPTNQAITYIGASPEAEGFDKPYSWYYDHVIEGAKQHRLPQYYIEALEQAEMKLDKDNARFEIEQGVVNAARVRRLENKKTPAIYFDLTIDKILAVDKD